MTKETKRRSLGELIGDSISPGLGSLKGWEWDQSTRQTNALEKITKEYKDRRLVQEVALRESSVSEKKIYDLPSTYVPKEVVKGFSNIVTAQHGTTKAVNENTMAVREGANLVYGGIMEVEQGVRELVDVSYSMDAHIQDVNASVKAVNHSVKAVNRSIGETNRLIDREITVLKDGFSGLSSQRKRPEQLIEAGAFTEIELIAAILKSDMKSDFFDRLPFRKKLLVRQAVTPVSDFHEPQYDEIKELTQSLKGEQSEGVILTKKRRIREIEKQIEEENIYMEQINHERQFPTDKNTLRVLARHGHIDPLIKDEMGETIPEVRTGTYGINQSMRDVLQMNAGVSPDRKSLQEVAAIKGMSEEELVALSLKGIVSKDEKVMLFRKFDDRKLGLISQVINFDSHFNDPILDEIEELKQRRSRTREREEIEVLTRKIRQKEQQLRDEAIYLQSLKKHLNAPLKIDSLRVLARHGHLDRFVQDEYGENIREVRTDMYGLNQNAREILSLMDEQVKNQELGLRNQEIQIENQKTQIGHQKIQIALGRAQLQELIRGNELQEDVRMGIERLEHTLGEGVEKLANLQQIQIEEQRESNELKELLIKKVETQIQLQADMLWTLGFIGEELSNDLNDIKDILVRTLEVTAWTSNRVLETLENIKLSIEDQTKNWHGKRFEERFKQAVLLLSMGKIVKAIKVLDQAQEEDLSDPRGYFMKGVSYMCIPDTEKAEEELLEAEECSKGLLLKGFSQQEVDEIVSKINVYLARLYFSLSEKENLSDVIQNKKRKQAIDCAQNAYEKNKDLYTGLDLALYLTLQGNMAEAYKVLEDLFRFFPKVVQILLNSEEFLPFIDQIKKNKWPELYQLHLKKLTQKK